MLPQEFQDENNLLSGSKMIVSWMKRKADREAQWAMKFKSTEKNMGDPLLSTYYVTQDTNLILMTVSGY